MEKAIKYIKFFDILSVRPQFLSNGRERFLTLYGGIMSISFFLLSISAFGYFFNSLLARENPIVYLNTNFNMSRSNVRKSEDMLLMFNMLTSRHLQIKEQDRHFQY